MRVRDALATVSFPASGRDLVAEGLIAGLHIDADGRVRFALEIPQGAEIDPEALLDAAKQAVARVEGVAAVSAVATAHSPRPAPAAGGHDNPLGMQKKPQIADAAENLKSVRRVVAVASGKGGVGKSTVAVNLAVALARQGLKTGLLDADIYGPSLPTLLGVHGGAQMRDDKIVPFTAHGITAMSIGMLIEAEQALAWRGPMVMGALGQLMRDVDWGALDIMLVDTPPGTGDAHLSLIQSKRLDGAVIVSTPQELALADVKRGVSLFRKTGVPILGVVENMAWLEGANGERQYLFGEGGARRAAAELGAPFLGAIPLYPALRESADAGTPLAAQDHPATDIFMNIAKRIADDVA